MKSAPNNSASYNVRSATSASCDFRTRTLNSACASGRE